MASVTSSMFVLRERMLVGALMICVAGLLPACSNSSGTGRDNARGGDAAVWMIDEEAPPTIDSRSFATFVSRVGCAGGETGKVRRPIVAMDSDQVTVTFFVEPVSGDQSCPGNKLVPYTVELDEPLGDRSLVDGACLAGDARSTSHCTDGAVRWGA